MKQIITICTVAVSMLFSGIVPLHAQQPVAPPAAYPVGTNLNYVRIWEAFRPGLDTGSIKTVPVASAKQATQYFDGLGRPLQSVAKQASPLGRDMVSLNAYDPFGREGVKYLPYISTSTDGKFKISPFTDQATFMEGQYGAQGETFFYGQTEFEPSPLGRPLKTLAPGNSWMGSNRGTAAKYGTNTVADSVALWRVPNNIDGALGACTMDGYYAPGKLSKSIATDEHGKQVVEYKDEGGKVLLKKVQFTAAIDDGSGSGHFGWLCTYYLYDGYGQLRCVLQPKAVETLPGSNWVPGTTVLDELAFQYGYDAQGNMVVKKVPGAAEVYMVYDNRDRLVLMQDGNLRTQGKWLQTKYDHLNRTVETGLLTNGLTAAQHRTAAENSSSYQPSGTYEMLTETYYDNYGYAGAMAYNSGYQGYLQAGTDAYPDYLPPATDNKGRVTGSKAKVLGTAQYLLTTVYYDKKGRTVQALSQNHGGGTDVSTNLYSWNGRLLCTYLHHQNPASAQTPALRVTTRMEYDKDGRVLKAFNKIQRSIDDDQPEVLLAQHEYDEMGQLKKKELGVPVGEAALETLAYDYNIRGWLLGVNRNYIKGTDNGHWFGFELAYDKPGNTVAGQSYTTPQYNGNISGSTWKAAGDGEKRKYDFTYDAVNRLTGADFNQFTGSGFNKTAGMDFSVSGLSYDANGNILGMEQKGWRTGGSGFIDQLQYSYQTTSNKLKGVTDASNDNSSKLGDFKYDAATKTATDYGYDANGSLVLDNNKKISNITYNHLNLPQAITITDQGSIEYLYDAVGNKLKKTVHETGKPDKVTDYLNGFVYEDGQLQFAPQGEGRIRLAKQYYLNGDSADVFAYDWFLKDHLGNVRTVLTAQRDTARYQAGFETSLREKEDALFANVGTTAFPINLINSSSLGELNEYNGEMASRLNGSELKTGAAITLKVMAGDKVDVGTQYWYPVNNATTTEPIEPDDLFSLLLGTLSGGASGLSGGKATPGELGTNGSPVYNALQSFLGNQTDPDNVARDPKAYLNWILLDEQFKYVPSGSGFIKVGGYSESWTALASTGIPVPKSGYLFVYLSNQTIGQNVFFDNLVVQHYAGPLTEENQYYPFGLVMKGISNRAYGKLGNRKLYNGNELQEKEFSDGNGLNFYDFNARSYDQQLGRFMQVDPLSDEENQESWTPYHFTYNNPVVYNDPDGRHPIILVAIWAWRAYRTYRAVQTIRTVANNAKIGTVINPIAGSISAGSKKLSLILQTNKAEENAAPTSSPVTPAASDAPTIKERHGGGKNAKHANQKARESAKDKYEAAKKEYDALKSKPNKTKEDTQARDAAEKQMKHWKQKMDNTGENHSQKAKGS